QYKECFVVVRCSFQGRTYSRCVYIWVDKDFAMVRGIHQGYPKKLGSIHQTRPHPYGRGAPRLGPGGRFGATPGAAVRRQAEAGVIRREPADANGCVTGPAMADPRYLPSIELDAPTALNELVESGAAGFEGDPAWKGDAELRLFDAPTEELSRLEVGEVIGAYYRQVGVVWNGGTRRWDGTADGTAR